jgi:uncharacterized phage protein gp47/JayE
MPFALPTLAELRRQAEADMEAGLRAARPDIDPAAIARAVRSERSVLGIIVRTQAQALFANHLHLRWWGDQYLPDTAEAEFLVRHSGIWGVERRPAVRAVGQATLAGTPALVVPAGVQMTNANGATIETTAAGILSGAGAATLPVRAVEGGTAGNAAGLAVLPLISPLPGLAAQAATLTADGLAGGAEIEDDEALLGRVLARIRQPAHGGAAFDYVSWIQNEFAAAKVSVEPGWVGRGSVGVIVAMGTAAAPVPPTAPELAAMLDYLGGLDSVTGVRPVTAEVVPVAFLPRVVALTIAIDPDTAPVRAAVQSALNAFFARDAEIGVALPLSRLSEAISGASGEYRHRIIAPAADIACAPRELAMPGVITWAAY